MRPLLVTCLICAVTACSPTATKSLSDGGSDQNAVLAGQLEVLAAPLVDPSGVRGKAVGIVVAVSTPQGRAIISLGATAVGGGAPSRDTVFEIGSISKVFTGLLLAAALADGTAALTDAIDPLFPGGAPHANGRAITLIDLATHTSGLPDFPNNPSSTDASNPFAGYSEADLATFMRSYSLPTLPGAKYLYSNLGAGTLGYVLVRQRGAVGFEALCRERITGPLQLADTSVTLTDGQRARRAQGYGNGSPAPEIDIGEPLVGSGALRSTAADMLRFTEAALGSGDPSMTAAWQRVMEPLRPSPNGTNAMTGLLLNLEDRGGRRVYSKNGETRGFSSQIMFTSSPPVAIVLLANSSDLGKNGELRKLSLAILDQVSPP